MTKNSIIKTNDINKFINNPNKSFKIINLNINDKIKDILSNININQNNVFNYFGKKRLDLQSNEYKSLIQLFNTDDNNIESIILLCKFIRKLLLEVCKEYNKNYCWITIRISTPSNYFDIHRWHYDGNYYKSDNIQTKFIITLKGDSTLIINPNNKIKKDFFNIKVDQNKLNDKELMKTQLLKNKVVSNEKIININTLINGIISISANPKLATIHSEPPIKNNRIFLSILPMTKNEMNDLKLRWNIK
jgi:hypothetical protein